MVSHIFIGVSMLVLGTLPTNGKSISEKREVESNPEKKGK